MSFSFNPSLWFICRSCKQIFQNIDELKQHKLENHLGHCLGVKYIVFEEKYVDKEWIPPDQEPSSISSKSSSTRFLNPYVSLAPLNLTNSGTKSQWKSERNSRSRNSDKASCPLNDIENSPQVSSLKRRSKRNLNLVSEKGLNKKVKSQPITNNYIEIRKPTFQPYHESESDPASTTLKFSEAEPEPDIKSEDETELESPSINDSNNLSSIIDAHGDTFFDSCDEPEIFSSLLEQDVPPAVDIDPLEIAEPQDCKPKLYTSLGEAEQSKPGCPPIGSLKRHMGTHGTGVPHRCSFCDKSFEIKRQLVMHERSHTGDYPFQCQVEKCGLSFTSKKTLQQHNCLVHFVELGLPQHICPVCDKVFGLKSKLRLHMRARHDQPKKVASYLHSSHLISDKKIHIDDRPFNCNQCPATFKCRSNLKRHMDTHGTCLSYECSFCEKSFAIKRQLVMHERSHTGDYPFQCQVDTCRKSFTSKKTLQQHNCLVHFVELGLPQHICTVCGKVFGLISKLRLHMRGRHDQGKKDGSYRHSNDLIRDTKIHIGNRPFKCDKCPTAYTHIKSFNRHMITHGIRVSHQCSFCDKHFSDRHRLVIHERTHTGDRPFQCQVENCKKAFASNSSLQQHTCLVHSVELGLPQYTCNVCGKVFAVKWKLSIHMRERHDPSKKVSKPHVCPLCFASFSFRGGLNVHKKIHIDDRPFKCEHCPATFKFKNSLKDHRVTHGINVSHQCCFCGKYYPGKNKLVAHERTHTGDFPFQCQVENCRKSFTSKRLLHQHNSLRHFVVLGLPRFLCPVCGRIFGLQSKLNLHMREKHAPVGSEPKPKRIRPKRIRKKAKGNLDAKPLT